MSIMLILSGYMTLSAHPNVTNKQEHQLSQFFELGIISEVYQAYWYFEMSDCLCGECFNCDERQYEFQQT